MIKLYKNRGQGENGEVIISTDAKDLREFESQFSRALSDYIKLNPGDIEHDLSHILPHSFQLAFKLEGYKTGKVHEQRLLIAGHSKPRDESLVYDTETKKKKDSINS